MWQLLKAATILFTIFRSLQRKKLSFLFSQEEKKFTFFSLSDFRNEKNNFSKK